MRYCFACFLFCFTASSAFSQEAHTYTLKECVDIALENNLNVRRGLYNVETFKLNLLQSKMAFFPTANVGFSYSQNYGRALNPVTNVFVNKNNNTINIQGNSGLTLFNGLRLQNTFRQNQKDYSASEKDLEKMKNDVILNIMTLYVNVIFNQELYANSSFQLNSGQQQFERIKKQVAAGSLPLGDQLNQEATVATNELDLINQENALNLSLLQLKQAMQLPSSTPIQLEISEIQPKDLVLEDTPDQIYNIALQSMPEIKSAQLKVESAGFALKANKGNLYPRLNLNSSITSNYSSASDNPRLAPDGTISLTNNPIGQVARDGSDVFGYVPNTTVTSESYGRTDQLQDNVFRTLNLSLTIPLFNGLQNRAGVQRAAINYEIATITEQETKNTLRQIIETAYNDAMAAAKSYSASLKQVNAREEAYRMSQQRFESGAINSFEFRISENELFQSKSDLSRSKYNFIFRKKILDFYQGKPIDH